MARNRNKKVGTDSKSMPTEDKARLELKCCEGTWRNLAKENFGRRHVPDSTAQTTDTLLCSYQLHNPQRKIAIIKRGGRNLNVTVETACAR